MSYPRNILWECTRCAACCGDAPDHKRQILLLPNEADDISRVTSLAIEDFAEETREAGLYAFRMRKDGGRCVFLDGNVCRIYPVRPLVCHFYPVWLRQEGSTYTFGVTDACPGLGEGKHLDREHFLSLLRLAQARLGAS